MASNVALPEATPRQRGATVEALRPHLLHSPAFLLAALAPAWLAVAWLASKASWFWNHHPDMAFGWVVLLLSAFLFWERWDRRPCPKMRFSWLVAAFAISGLAIVVFAQLAEAAFGLVASTLLLLSFGALLIVAANLHYLMGSPGVRNFAFPFLFLLVALPLPSGIYAGIVSSLQSWVAGLNVEILNLLGIPAERTGSLIRLATGAVGVDEACSGIRSLQSMVMATLFVGATALHSFFARAFLFLSGLVLAFLGNVLRSLFLSITANARGPEAVASMHDPAGWSVLAFAAAGLILVAWMLTKAEKAFRACQTPPPVEQT